MRMLFPTGVQHVSMDRSAGKEPKALPEVVLCQQETEFTLVCQSKEDAEPTDVQELCGCFSGPTAKSRGYDAFPIQ